MSLLGIAVRRRSRLVAVALLSLILVRLGEAQESPIASPAALVAARNRMVDQEIVAAGVKNPRVIQAMRDTPRHEFVGVSQRERAYFDMALPIGSSQTISPPFIVAYMTEQIDPQPDDKVLEIGTGSGYQAAILSPLANEVYSIEIVKPLAARAKQVLKRLKYENVFTKQGDGYQGWPEHAPFDKIIVTCSPERVPVPLIEQLREGGRMIVPVGERYQQTLYLFEKRKGKLDSVALLPTLFVPMTGAAEEGRQVKPDPANPKIQNGGFEQTISQPESTEKRAVALQPTNWHYQRQLVLADDPSPPEGSYYAKFTNRDAGRGSWALQGMAIDGRKVKELELSLMVRAMGVQRGRSSAELPVVKFMFYDQNRGQTGVTSVGPWQGTFDWMTVKESIRVPQSTREAIIQIGLHGATGELGLDDLEVKAIKR